MRNSEDSQCDRLAMLIEVLGGEALGGTGFENEEPERGFTAAELEGEE